MAAPVYVIFAGVNGAGKSTFFHSDVWLQEGLSRNMPRVNSDEIVVQNRGDYRSDADQIRAGRQARALIEDYFARGASFNQETTLTGRLALKNIRRAHDLGYRVLMYYIGVDSPETSLARIAHRTSVGGHPIDEAVVRRRYEASLRNFSNVLDFCDQATVVDNTLRFVSVAQWTKGVLSWVGNLKAYAPWFFNVVRDSAIWRA